MVRQCNFLIANYLDLVLTVEPQIRSGNTLARDLSEMNYPANALMYLEIQAQLMVRHCNFLIANSLELVLTVEPQIRGGHGCQGFKEDV